MPLHVDRFSRAPAPSVDATSSDTHGAPISSWLPNRKKESLDFEITFRFGGKAEAVTDAGKVVIAPFNGADWENYRGSPAVNNSSVVSWKSTVEPGKTFEPKVTYHYFARH